MSRQYLDAARVVGRVRRGDAGLKNAIFGAATGATGGSGSAGGGGGGGDGSNIRRLYAVASETLKQWKVLERVLATADSVTPSTFADVDNSLLMVMLYDALLGSGRIDGGGHVKRLLAQHLPALRTALEAIAPGAGPRLKKGVPSSGGGASTEEGGRPRFVRVNTIKMTVPEAVAALVAHAGTGARAGSGGAEPSHARLPAGALVAPDPHIPQVLALPADAHRVLELHRHPLVTGGRLILQDKASCFPAYALLGDLVPGAGKGHVPDWAAPQRESCSAGGGDRVTWQPFDAIDACAAPGNKTSQLAALLHEIQAAASTGAGAAAAIAPAATGHKRKRGTEEGAATALLAAPGRVFAFDRSEARLATLVARMAEAGADNVVPTLADFLTVQPADPRYARVRCVLLDPSCSGSGMLEHLAVDGVSAPGSSGGASSSHGGHNGASAGGDGTDSARVKHLAEFQRKALIHAMGFPHARRIVYSTCSVHVTENEAVVSAALAHGTAAGWRLAAALPAWPRRGLVAAGLDAAQAACLIRADPAVDGTIGFFVALFHRDADGPAGGIVPAPRAADAQQQKQMSWAGGDSNSRATQSSSAPGLAPSTDDAVTIAPAAKRPRFGQHVSDGSGSGSGPCPSKAAARVPAQQASGAARVAAPAAGGFRLGAVGVPYATAGAGASGGGGSGPAVAQAGGRTGTGSSKYKHKQRRKKVLRL
jgi:putative methyltransferase